MKVRVAPLQPHSLAFGGFDIQMITVLKATREAGVDVERLDPWSRDSDYDVLHVWGLSEAHLPALQWAKKAGKRVVLSALLPYLSPRARLGRIRALANGRARRQREILGAIDRLVVVNTPQAETAVQLLGFPRDRVDVIPHLVDEQYFLARGSVSSGDYVLCAGNICRRKNQLRLVRACQQEGVPLLLVGDVLTGEDEYGRAVEQAIAAARDARWILGLPPGSPELLSAYKDSCGAALVSYHETQPISLLEAAAVGRPLLIADRAYARQEFYENAVLVDPSSVKSIGIGLRRLVENPERYHPPAADLNRCTREAVGEGYATVYRRAIERP